MMNLITNAIAATSATTAAPESAGMGTYIYLIAIVAMLYFMVILPQTKRAKAQRQLIASIQKGDEVVTSGGILGKIAEINDDFMTLSIAPAVEITVQKGSVVTSLPKGTLKW